MMRQKFRDKIFFIKSVKLRKDKQEWRLKKLGDSLMRQEDLQNRQIYLNWKPRDPCLRRENLKRKHAKLRLNLLESHSI